MDTATQEHLRSFIAIALEPAWIVELKQVQRQFQNCLPQDAVRWVRPEQLHLTLKFLGNVSRNCLADLAAALNRACVGIAPFELRLSNVGCFPDAKNPRVVWVGINGELEPLRRLQAQVENQTQAFGDHREQRAFQPHLTIGRVTARGRTAREVGELVGRIAVGRPGQLTVRQVHLLRSDLLPEGARYTKSATVDLVDSNAVSRAE